MTGVYPCSARFRADVSPFPLFFLFLSLSSHSTGSTTWLDPRAPPRQKKTTQSTVLLKQLEQTLLRQEEERYLQELKKHVRDDSGYISRVHSNDDLSHLV